MSFLSAIVVVLSLVPSGALKLRSHGHQAPTCGIVEWEANASWFPCWLRGECDKRPATRDRKLYGREGVGAHGSKTNTRGNVKFGGALFQPQSIEELVTTIQTNPKLNIVATGHSSGLNIAPGRNDAGLISLWNGFRHIRMDTCKM